MTVSGCLLLLLLPLLTVQETIQDTVLAQQSPELFVKGSHFRWPGGKVPYVFEKFSRFSFAEKEVVRRAMDDIQDRTGCVDFEETDIARGSDIVDNVLITKRGLGTSTGQGCWAHGGRQGGTQAINLGVDCITTKAVTHQLLHTLGWIGHYNDIMSESVAIEVSLAYGCALKPDNVEMLQTVQDKHTDQIKALKGQMKAMMDKCGSLVQAAFSVTDLTADTCYGTCIRKFSNVKVDTAQAYSVGTGVYTVPYDGTYFFTWTLLAGFDSHATVLLYVDDSESGASVGTSTGEAYNSMTGSVVLQLTEGQQVTIRKRRGNLQYSTPVNSFSGFLIA